MERQEWVQQREVKQNQRNKMREQEKKKELKEEKLEKKEEIKTDSSKEKPLEVKKVEKKKKQESKIRAVGAPISTRHSVAICKFIKKKEIEKAIKLLEEVLSKKRALPMKGEFAHKKGIMAGKYPYNSTKYFIKLLKSLQANANLDDVKNPIITEAIANLAPRPRGRFGRYKRKRTHIEIIAKEIQKKENKKLTEAKK